MSATMEPTVEQCNTFKTLHDLADWAALPGAAGDVATPRGSFLTHVGSPTGMVDVAEIGETSLGDWIEAVNEWRIGEARPNVLLKTAAKRIGLAARICVGTQLRKADEAAATKAKEEAAGHNAVDQAAAVAAATAAAQAAAANAGTLCNVVKLSNYVDQTLDAEVPQIPRSRLDQAYENWRVRMGREPSPDVTPSKEQLAALVHLVEVMGEPPYVCFSLFGPHAVRTSRKLKFSGMILSANGDWTRRELVGPADIAQWTACYKVFRTACIMGA